VRLAISQLPREARFSSIAYSDSNRRDRFYAGGMRVVYGWYAGGMRLLCWSYAGGMRVVCGWYAPAMRLLCVYYASTMRLSCYASTMRLLCACYAGGMRLLCVRYASAMRLLCGCYAGVCPAGVCLVVGPLWPSRTVSGRTVALNPPSDQAIARMAWLSGANSSIASVRISRAYVGSYFGFYRLKQGTACLRFILMASRY